jgi:cytochrome b subunit of formate dehydrogenase
MDWTPVLEFLMTLAPWVSYVFMGLGALVVIATAVDAIIPDEKDHGFMKKIMAIPVLGDLLKAISKFSPFNHRE